MVNIRNESDLNNWFKKNYKKLDFSKIFRYDVGGFPDFIMLRGGKKVRVELEVKSSNFVLHKHPANEVDEVICIEKDVDLKVPITELKNFKLAAFDKQSSYSMTNQIYDLFRKEKIMTASEVVKFLKVSWNTVDSYLKELLIEGKLERIKKRGTSLWMKK
jgi:predicted HTH transcriptional regulator